MLTGNRNELFRIFEQLNREKIVRNHYDFLTIELKGNNSIEWRWIQMCKKYVPDFEMFGTVPYKAHCGKCGRMMFVPGQYRTVEQIRKAITFCPCCLAKIDWGGDTDG